MKIYTTIFNVIQAAFHSLCVVILIKFVLEKTETRIFSKDAIAYLKDDKKLAELEKKIVRDLY